MYLKTESILWNVQVVLFFFSLHKIYNNHTYNLLTVFDFLKNEVKPKKLISVQYPVQWNLCNSLDFCFYFLSRVSMQYVYMHKRKRPILNSYLGLVCNRSVCTKKNIPSFMNLRIPIAKHPINSMKKRSTTAPGPKL